MRIATTQKRDSRTTNSGAVVRSLVLPRGGDSVSPPPFADPAFVFRCVFVVPLPCGLASRLGLLCVLRASAFIPCSTCHHPSSLIAASAAMCPWLRRVAQVFLPNEPISLSSQASQSQSFPQLSEPPTPKNEPKHHASRVTHQRTYTCT